MPEMTANTSECFHTLMHTTGLSSDFLTSIDNAAALRPAVTYGSL